MIIKLGCTIKRLFPPTCRYLCGQIERTDSFACQMISSGSWYWGKHGSTVTTRNYCSCSASRSILDLYWFWITFLSLLKNSWVPSFWLWLHHSCNCSWQSSWAFFWVSTEAAYRNRYFCWYGPWSYSQISLCRLHPSQCFKFVYLGDLSSLTCSPYTGFYSMCPTQSYLPQLYSYAACSI